MNNNESLIEKITHIWWDFLDNYLYKVFAILWAIAAILSLSLAVYVTIK